MTSRSPAGNSPAARVGFRQSGATGFKPTRATSLILTSEAGFTLVELLVAVTIIGLLLAIVPTQFSGTSQSLNRSTVSQTLLNDLAALRDSAIASGSEARLVIDAQSTTYSLSSTGQTRHLPDGYSIMVEKSSAADDADTSILFYADGSSSGGRLIVRDHGKTTALRVKWITGRAALDE